MKFNRSEIMKAAWKKFNRFDLTFAQALHLAWAEAKLAAMRFNVWAESFGMSEPVLLGGNLTNDEAEELVYWKKSRYDRVWTVKAA